MNRLAPILLILLAASAIRILGVASWPVATDEGWSAWVASDHAFSAILDKVANDRHPPLYFLALSAWSTIAGDSRVALRFLNIISGLLTVAVAYRIGADWFGRRAALYGALLVAIAQMTVYYSQEIRHYGWLIFWVCWITFLFLRWLRRPRAWLSAAYAVGIALMLYTLYFGAMILVVHALVGLFVWRAQIKQKLALIATYVAAFVLYIPWIPTLLHQLGYLGIGIPSYPTSFGGLLAAGGLLFGKENVGLGLTLYLLAVAYVLQHRTHPYQIQHAVVMLSGGGLFVGMAVINLRIGTLQARTLVYLAPFLLIVCGYGLSLIERAGFRNLLAFAFVILALNPDNILQPRMDSDVMARTVAAEYTPGDPIILEGGWDDFGFRYELLQAIPHDVEPDIVSVLPWGDYATRQGYNDWPSLSTILNAVQNPLGQAQRVWVVNYWVPSRLIPYLETGNTTYHETLTYDIPAGAQYSSLYPDHPTIRVRLFERPAPLSAAGTFQSGLRYGDIFQLQGALVPPRVTAGQLLHIDLWWSALKPPPLDYSVGVYLMDANGTVRAQHDGPPGNKPTSQWTVGDVRFDRHTLQVPINLTPGTYRIRVQVYWFGDRKPLPANKGTYADIGSVQLE